MNKIDRKQFQIDRTLKDLIDLLPSAYNKETSDTNYYKLLRALANELADTKVEVETVKNNAYLETVSPEAIYRNFGTLVKLNRMPEWDDNKYKDLIKGVIQSLLMGPTKDSIVKAFKMFTNFDVQVHELYKDHDKVDPAIYQGYNPKFTFLLEIEKPIDTYAENKTLQRDANYIIGILKPAHTIGLQIINLTDSEDFRFYYGVDRQINNLAKTLIEEKIDNKENEILNSDIERKISLYANNNNVGLDEASDAIYIRRYGKSRVDFQNYLEERANNLYEKYLEDFENNKKNLNSNDGAIIALNIDYFKNIINGILRKEYSKTSKVVAISKVETNHGFIFNSDIEITDGEDKYISIILNTDANMKRGYSVNIDVATNVLKISNLQSKEELHSTKITPKINGKFNLKIETNDNIITVCFNDNQTITHNFESFENWFFGFETGRSIVEFSNMQINNEDISELEKKYDNENPENFWRILPQKTSVHQGIIYEKNNVKCLMIPGVLDRIFLDNLKNNLYIESNSQLTQTKLTQKVNIEKEKLKEIYLKKGFNPTDISEEEWDKITENNLKDATFRENIIDSLGGLKSLYSFCLSEASKFKDELELIYNNSSPYLGMDKVEVEGNNTNNEGNFGWKHLSYLGQLTTSITFNGPKIGGTNLIGPRYTLYDDSTLTVEDNNTEFIGLASLSSPMKLSPFTLKENGEYVINKNSLNQSRILGFDSKNNPRFANQLSAIKKDAITHHHIDTIDYEEDAINNKMNPNGILTPQKFKQPDEFMIPDYEIDEEFKFTSIRNSLFKLNKDPLNGKLKIIGIDIEPNVEDYNLSLDFEEEKSSFALNINTFKLNSAILNSSNDALSITDKNLLESIEVEGQGFYDDHIVTEKTFDIHDKTIKSFSDENFKFTKDRLPNENIKQTDHQNEILYDTSENVGFISKTSSFRIQFSDLNNNGEKIIGFRDDKFENILEFGNIKLEKFKININADSVTNIDVDTDDHFLLTPIRDNFKLNESKINQSLNEPDNFDNITLENTEIYNYVETKNFTLNSSKLNSKNDTIGNEIKDIHSFEIGEYTENVDAIIENNLIEQNIENLETFYMTPLRNAFRMNKSIINNINKLGAFELLDIINNTKLDFQEEKFNTREIIDNLECVLVKIDENGNEIIIERRVI